MHSTLQSLTLASVRTYGAHTCVTGLFTTVILRLSVKKRTFTRMRIRELVQNKLPFWCVVPVAVVLFYASWVLIVLSFPLVYLYGYAVLFPLLRSKWGKTGKDVLLVSTNTEDAREWAARILPFVESRAVFLDYEERHRWDRWSLAVQLFGWFGPLAIPDKFTRDYLPAVILVKPKNKPKRFLFGKRRRNRYALFDQLRAELSEREQK